MALKKITVFCFLSLILTSCSTVSKIIKEVETSAPAKPAGAAKPKTTGSPRAKTFTKPLKIDRGDFVSYAKTLLGTPYKYGSAVPKNGLDCSGFVTNVFGHFNVKAPRSSVDFTSEGQDIELKKARAGDIILFSGSDNSTGIVGHMGIITANGNSTQFIHSASGKSIGVILSNFSGYYKTHFVKVIRILE